jgi:hypothetical protein
MPPVAPFLPMVIVRDEVAENSRREQSTNARQHRPHVPAGVVAQIQHPATRAVRGQPPHGGVARRRVLSRRLPVSAERGNSEHGHPVRQLAVRERGASLRLARRAGLARSAGRGGRPGILIRRFQVTVPAARFLHHLIQQPMRPGVARGAAGGPAGPVTHFVPVHPVPVERVFGDEVHGIKYVPLYLSLVTGFETHAARRADRRGDRRIRLRGRLHRHDMPVLQPGRGDSTAAAGRSWPSPRTRSSTPPGAS